MMRIGCASYSFVGAVPGYGKDRDRGDEAEPEDLGVVGELIERVKGCGVEGLEFWFNHIPVDTLTTTLAGEITGRLLASGLACAACGGSVGDPRARPEWSAKRFMAASLLGAGIIAGDFAPGAVSEVTELCKRFKVRMAYENHPESSCEQILERIDGGSEWVGVALDTGSLAEHGGDPVAAVHELGSALMHVHVRDVAGVGSEESVSIGEGIVDVSGVVDELRRHDYDGWASIEVPLAQGDPAQAVAAAVPLIRRLAAG